MSFLSCSIESCSRHIHKTLKDFKMNKNVKNSEHITILLNLVFIVLLEYLFNSLKQIKHISPCNGKKRQVHIGAFQLSAKLYNSKAVVEYNIYGNSKQLNSLSLGINSKYAT